MELVRLDEQQTGQDEIGITQSPAHCRPCSQARVARSQRHTRPKAHGLLEAGPRLLATKVAELRTPDIRNADRVGTLKSNSNRIQSALSRRPASCKDLSARYRISQRRRSDSQRVTPIAFTAKFWVDWTHDQSSLFPFLETCQPLPNASHQL